MMKLANIEGRNTLGVFKDTSSLIEVYTLDKEKDYIYMVRIGESYLEMNRRGATTEKFIREYMDAPVSFIEAATEMLKYVSYDEIRSVSLFKEREFDSHVDDLGDCVKYVAQDILISLDVYRDRLEVERIGDDDMGMFDSFIVNIFEVNTDFGVFTTRHLMENMISNMCIGNDCYVEFTAFGKHKTLVSASSYFIFGVEPVLVDIPPFDYYNEDLTLATLGKFTKLIMSGIYKTMEESTLGNHLLCGYTQDRGYTFTPKKLTNGLLEFSANDRSATCLAYKHEIKEDVLILDVALWSEVGYVHFKRARVELSGEYTVEDLYPSYEIYTIPLDEEGEYIDDKATGEFTEAVMYDIRMKLCQASFDDIANSDSEVMKSIKDKVIRIYTRNGYTLEDAQTLIKY